jgi:hypothetical protein
MCQKRPIDCNPTQSALSPSGLLTLKQDLGNTKSYLSSLSKLAKEATVQKKTPPARGLVGEAASCL